MSKYLDPKSDVVFKKVFGDHPHLLKHFLNAVLPLSEDERIDSLEYLQAEQVPEIPIFKRTIVDVKCKDCKGNIFIVEMQMEWTDSFMQRLLFGAAQAYVKQLKVGEDYHLLNPVYGLALIDSIFDKETPDWYHHYGLVKMSNPIEKIIKGLTLVFVELPKFQPTSKDEKKLKLLWLRFMKEITTETEVVDQALLEVPEIKEAIDLTKKAAYSRQELEFYDSYWKQVSSERTLRSGARMEGKMEGLIEGKEIGLMEGKEIGLIEGKEIGLMEGKEIGLEIGLNKGKEIGILEGIKKLVLMMKGQGLSIEQIVSFTGLPKEEVESFFMSKYLDPKSDVVFKKVFGDHPHLLKHFLNAVLPLSEDEQIDSLEYLQAEQVPEIPIFKRTIVDVKCKDCKGNIFIVEMQMEWTDSFMQRLLFGAAQAYVKQLKVGEDYHLLNPVYGLALIDSIFDKETPDWYHHYGLVKMSNPAEKIIKGLTLVFVELPKFHPTSKDEKKLKLLWLRFMKEITTETEVVDQALLEVPEIKEAIDLTKKAAYSRQELEFYDSYWKQVSSERTLRSGARMEGKMEGLIEGKEIGLMEGKEIGLEIGLNKGKEIGILEGIKKLVLMMKGQGLSIEQIVSFTGLPKEEVESFFYE